MGNDIAKEEKRREVENLYAHLSRQRRRQEEALFAQEMEEQRRRLQLRYAAAPAPHVSPTAPASRVAATSPVARATTAPATRADATAPIARAVVPAQTAQVAATPRSRLDLTEEVKSTNSYTAEKLHSMSALSQTGLYPQLGGTVTNVNENQTQPPRADASNNNLPKHNAQLRHTATRQTEAGSSANVIGQDFGVRAPSAVNNNAFVYNEEQSGNFKQSPRSDGVTPTPRGARPYVTSNAAPSTSIATFKGNDDFVMVNNYSKEHYAPSAPRERDLPRSRNASRNRAAIGSDDGSRCSTCDRPFTLEIYQCGGGHSVCEMCRARGVRCAACGEQVLPMRNHQLEDLIREKRTECPNTVDGCSLRPRRVEMAAHLRECIYRVMDCPMTGVYGICTWKGKREDMMDHFMARHHEHCQAKVNQEMTLRRLDRDDRIIHLVPLDNYLFLVHIKISEASQTLSLAVQLIGTASGARKWCYAVNVYDRAEPRRKLDYRDACAPDAECVEALFAAARCLVLPLAYLRGFAGRGGVAYKLFVTRAEARARAPAGRGRGRGGRGAAR